MRFSLEENHRRSLRLEAYDYSQAGAYFVTLCAKDREGIFGEMADGSMTLSAFGEIARACWEDLPSCYPHVELDAFVVMPNHIHGIIVISVGAIHELPLHDDSALQNYRMRRRKMLLPKIVGYIRMSVGKRINQLRNTLGAPVWQRNYYEHVIRNEESLNAIRQYIAQNPVNWAHDEENPVNICRGNS